MVKYYCDGCGKEITEGNKASGGTVSCHRLGTKLRRNGIEIGVELMTSMDGVSNNGLFCKHCILDAFYKLDDRPKQEKR